MEQPKFILTNTNQFRLGMVHQHKNLLRPGERCYGGGYYEFDYLANQLILTGTSYDFGRPKWERFATLYVPADYRGLRIIYRTRSNGEGDFIVNNEIKIEYV